MQNFATTSCRCPTRPHDPRLSADSVVVAIFNMIFFSGHAPIELTLHYIDVIMSVMASQITSLIIVYLTVYSGAGQRKHQSSASLAFVRGLHRWPANSPHKCPVTRKMFQFDDVIMNHQFYSWRHFASAANIIESEYVQSRGNFRKSLCWCHASLQHIHIRMVSYISLWPGSHKIKTSIPPKQHFQNNCREKRCAFDLLNTLWI